jgi:hypothetical protein
MFSGCRPNQSSANAQALAAFSSTTGRPTADSIIVARFTSFPAQVWREQQSAVRADPAWQADANPLADDVRVRATHGGDRAREPSYERLRRVRCWPRRLLDEPGVDAAETNCGDLGTQLDGEDPGSLDIEVEESRAPAARRVADRAFRDPAFIDQLVDDGRYGASLQTRSPRQIGA